MLLRKSRVQTPNLDNYGGYMIVDEQTQGVVRGFRWDWTLDDVEQWLRETNLENPEVPLMEGLR